ncbi:MAG: diguanylate cyclase [Candidatus Thiodiazotropha sp. (ex Dulcina madagascariensis)]|nr:diguanylate cyclase [Candidatus Thiodiazotropha sp. (ex Dulcina madagascariensis)]
MTGKDEKSDIQAALAVLKERFTGKITAKVGEICQNWEKLKSTPEDLDTFGLLHRQVHTLAGTSATYGFEETGRLAGEIEIVLQDELTENHAKWTTELLDKVGDLLLQLEAVAQSEPVEKNHGIEIMAPRQVAQSGNRPRKLIYLVDDDDDFLNTMKIQIQAFGYDVQAFSDLALFDEAVQRQEPTAVVMDVIFGDSSKAGIEHIANINMQRKQALKTIFITGSQDVLTRLDAVRAGGAAYFPKPVLVGSLMNVIDRLAHPSIEEPFRIVIVDDSEEMSGFSALALQQAGMETREVNDPLQLFSVLARFPPDLILMDIYMPSCSGLELSKVIRQMDSYITTPIVFLSLERDLKKQLGAMSLGGDDFLSKPIEPWHLVSAVTSRVQRGRMMRKLAETDGLTGLLNHSKSKERLVAELSRAKREKTPLSFALLDIDHFKQVNDTYGHPAGDQVLKSLANILKQRLRQYDTIGRYGGEEYIVILPNTDVSTAKSIMDKIRISFSEISHSSEKGHFSCRFSCGIASFPDFDNTTILNNEADKALYEAKEGGRNRVVVSSAGQSG